MLHRSFFDVTSFLLKFYEQLKKSWGVETIYDILFHGIKNDFDGERVIALNNHEEKINKYANISEEIKELSELCLDNFKINPELYAKYEVKRGLRDINGKGVLAGLTDVSKIQSYIVEDDDMIPCEGKLYYQGVDVEDIVAGFIKEKRFQIFFQFTPKTFSF